jgi:TnpA family transposase
MIRHYMLSAADLAMIRRGRGDHHRLGLALMLCYLRYPGRPLCPSSNDLRQSAA